MTTTITRARLALLVLATALIVAVAGCGGSDDGGSTGDSASTGSAAAATTADESDGGGGGDFCKQLADVGPSIGTTADDANPENLSEAFSKAAKALDDVDPPGEIEDDWNVLVDFFSEFADVFDGIDVNDPSSLADLQEQMSKLEGSQEKLTAATQAISAYASEECGIDDLG